MIVRWQQKELMLTAELYRCNCDVRYYYKTGRRETKKRGIQNVPQTLCHTRGCYYTSQFDLKRYFNIRLSTAKDSLNLMFS